jgi:hypothetical protein
MSTWLGGPSDDAFFISGTIWTLDAHDALAGPFADLVFHDDAFFFADECTSDLPLHFFFPPFFFATFPFGALG